MRTFTRWWGLLPLLLVFSLAARGQSPDQSQAQADRKVLDKRLELLITDPRLTTGFLLDWGLALDDLTHYHHPEVAPDSVISSTQMFRRAYATLAFRRNIDFFQ